jgi:hypothetical protein
MIGAGRERRASSVERRATKPRFSRNTHFFAQQKLSNHNSADAALQPHHGNHHHQQQQQQRWRITHMNRFQLENPTNEIAA